MIKCKVQDHVLLLFALLLFLPVLSYSQSDLIVEPFSGENYLNAVIEADAARPADRVYVLRRGDNANYFVNTVITNTGWTLRIRAEEGTGRRPIVYLTVNTETSTFPTHFVQMAGDLWLKDLMLCGFIEAVEGEIANNPPRLIRCQSAGWSLTIDGCLITESRGEHIRLEAASRVVKITNTVFANMGDLGTSNLGAGKPIDFRDTSCDSAIFVDNTFVNFQDRIIRHRASVGPLKYFKFDHNTIVNSLGYHGTLALGFLGDDAIITNNLFLDNFVAGADTDGTRQSEFNETTELDPRNGLGKMFWVLSVPNDSTNWTVAGNYYSVSPAVQSFYESVASAGVQGEGPPLTHHINTRLGADSANAFTKEAISLENIPGDLVNMAVWYRDPLGGNKRKNTPCACWDRATDDYDRRPWQYFSDTLSCSYLNNLAAAHGATDGGQVGDRNWPLINAAGAGDLIVEPFSGDNYLNAVIAADVPRPDDRVYVLRRGDNANYFVNTVITNTGWTLRIRAEEGTGRRPIVYLTVNTETSTFPTHFVQMAGDLWLKDLILCGFIEAVEGEIANNPPRLIRCQSAGWSLTIDGCLITESRGEHIRLEAASRVVKITNTVFANMGDLGTSNLGAGKPIDFRDTSCDSAIFVDNTFVNFQDRIIRHRASVGPLKYFKFDHNTIVNSLGYHGTLALGFLGDDAIITNNLFLDNFVAGADTDGTRQSEFNETTELDPRNGLGKMFWVLSVPNDSTNWTVAGNYYSVSPAVQSFYESVASAGVQGEGPPLTHHINTRLGADSANAFTKEAISLENIPGDLVNMAVWYRDPLGGNKKKNTPCACWDRATDDYDRRPWQYFSDTLSCSYLNSLAAATGATDGGQVGDRNWNLIIDAISGDDQNVPQAYHLTQNYPNPFNPVTKIGFSINKVDRIRLEIYNISGQKIATLIDQRMKPGTHEVEWDASHVASGIYFYKFYYGAMTATRKMVLIR